MQWTASQKTKKVKAVEIQPKPRAIKAKNTVATNKVENNTSKIVEIPHQKWTGEPIRGAAVLPTGVRDGASVKIASNHFVTDDHTVKFKLDIENHTNQKLELVETGVHSRVHRSSGKWGKKIPQRVFPGKRESLFGRKSSVKATGVAGTISWKIGNGDCAVVMFSLPYDFNLYSNWLSVGIMKESDVQGGGSELFDKMYNEEGNFTRGQFYTDPPKPIEFKSGSYKIVGVMGTTHEPEIKIQIFAVQKEKAPKALKTDEGSSSDSSDSE